MSNQEQIEFWNGEVGRRWAERQELLDAALAAFGEAALARAGAARGERVLDVGCGCGSSALALAAAVGEAGSVVGVDISEPMLARAKQRLAGARHVSLLLADASTYAVTPPVDLVFSRFGVMFFDDPPAAFANLRAQLRPGGRVTFVCWRPLAENPWMLVALDAVRAIFPPAPPAPPEAPGPFALGDRERTARILAAAQLDDVAIEPFDADVLLSQAGLDDAVDFAMQTGPTARLAREADEATVARAREAVTGALAQHVRGGRVALPGATWIVSARRRE